jgi:hypothetical protein
MRLVRIDESQPYMVLRSPSSYVFGLGQSIRRNARAAGLWYLLLAATGPLYLIYIPSVLIKPGDAALTVSNVLASGSLFRLGIAAEFVGAIASVLLVLAPYEVFKGVDKKLAVMMVVLGGVIPVAISFVSVLGEVAALYLLGGASSLSAFSTSQIDALVMLFLNLHIEGQTVINGIFYGLWLLPFGVLVFRSGYFPRVLGIWLVVNGFAYPASSSGSLFLPDYAGVISEIAPVFYTGELAMVAWLLVKGAKVS